MRVKVEYIVGNPSSSEWSGVYGYKPDTSDEIEFFSVMRLKADVEEVSLEMMAKMLFDEVQSSFFEEGNPERDLVLRLETAALKMKSKMDLILSREESLSKKGLDIEMAIAVVYQNYLYLGVVGESKIFIQRDSELIEVSQALTDGDMGGFLKSGSLEIEDTDRLILATSKMASFEKNIEEAVTNLDINLLSNAQGATGAAGILIADEGEPWSSNAVEEIVEPEAVVEDAEELEPEVLTASEAVDDVEPEIETQPTEEELEDPNELLEEEIEEESPMKQKLNALKLGLMAGSAKTVAKVKAMTNRNKEIEIDEPDDGATRFTDINQPEIEDEEYIEEEKLHKKVIKTASGFSSSAKTQWNQKWGPKVKGNQKTYMKFLKSIGGKILIFVEGIASFFKREVIGTGDRRDFMKGKSRSRNRKIVIVVLIVLVVVLYFGLRSADAARREQEIVDTARKNVDGLEERYNNLSSQVSQAKGDNEDKKNLILNELTNLTNDVNNQKKSGLFKDELDQISSNILVSQDELLFVEAFTEPKLITDVGKTFPDAKLTDIVYSNGSVFISDEARNSVYRVTSSSLDGIPEAYVTDLVQPYLLVRDAAGDIIFYDNDTTSALGKFGYSEPNLTRFGQLSLASIGKPTESVIFDGNNALYELKAMNRQIFKRDKTGDTYVNGGAATSTDPDTNWRTDPDFANGIDIAAPYEIYVLITGQGVKRYFAKAENTLTFETYNNFLKKDFDSLTKASSFDVTTRYMAVGDPVNKRVMLFQVEDNETKDITFIKQFVYRGDEAVFNDIKEIAINEQERAVYVLDASKVIKLQF